MTSPSAPASTAGGSPHPVLPMKAVVAVVIGNWLEFYDFLVFTFFAVMIGDAFFPGESEFSRLLGALATFGVGFVTRPLGAAIIGPYADRVGRRAALTLTLLLMSVGSAMIALTPPYCTDRYRRADPAAYRPADSGLLVRRGSRAGDDVSPGVSAAGEARCADGVAGL